MIRRHVPHRECVDDDGGSNSNGPARTNDNPFTISSIHQTLSVSRIDGPISSEECASPSFSAPAVRGAHDGHDLSDHEQQQLLSKQVHIDDKHCPGAISHPQYIRCFMRGCCTTVWGYFQSRRRRKEIDSTIRQRPRLFSVAPRNNRHLFMVAGLIAVICVTLLLRTTKNVIELILWVRQTSILDPTIVPYRDTTMDRQESKLGKHCEYQQKRQQWYCQECYYQEAMTRSVGIRAPSDTSSSKDRMVCKQLHERDPTCPSFPRHEWDSLFFTRVASTTLSNPLEETNAAMTSNTGAVLSLRTLNFYRKYFHTQPDCTVTECWEHCHPEAPCRTISYVTSPMQQRSYRCREMYGLGQSLNRIFTVYVNQTGENRATTEHTLMDYAIQHFNVSGIELRRIDDHSQACLVLVEPGQYGSADELYNSEHWRASQNGQNHFIWKYSRIGWDRLGGMYGDVPFSTSFSVGKAAVAAESLTRAHMRPQYDMVLPLERKWGRPVAPSQVDVHRPRTHLLSFRGRIFYYQHPYFQHRWLAYQYWDRSFDAKDHNISSQDVVIDVECVHINRWDISKKTVVHPYQSSSSSYEDMMWNSVFGFAPGGSAVGSFRFGEILSTGGIPVVVGVDFVPPLAPEVDWSSCVVYVTESRIIDLPSILRSIPESEVRQRQTACWHLFHSVYGDRRYPADLSSDGLWRGDDRVTFTLAMELWALRVFNSILTARVASMT